MPSDSYSLLLSSIWIEIVTYYLNLPLSCCSNKPTLFMAKHTRLDMPNHSSYADSNSGILTLLQLNNWNPVTNTYQESSEKTFQIIIVILFYKNYSWLLPLTRFQLKKKRELQLKPIWDFYSSLIAQRKKLKPGWNNLLKDPQLVNRIKAKTHVSWSKVLSLK